MELIDADSLADYARMLDAVPITSWIADPDGAVVYVSPMWERLTGVDAKHVYQTGYVDLLHPDDVERVIANWNAAQAARTGYRDETRVRSGDGSYRWFLSQSNPIVSPGGDLLGWVGTITDIHDRRVAEDTLAEQNLKLEEADLRRRLIAETLPGTTWTADPDGKLDRIVDGFFDIARRAPEARYGDEWLAGVHPQDRERTRRSWRHAIETSTPYEETFRVEVADGSYRWHIARALPHWNADGNVAGWVGLGIDIDDRMRADAEREKFVALAEKSSDIIGIADADGMILYANPAALAFLETTYEDILGRHFTICLPPEDLPFVANVVMPTIDREGRWLGDYRCRNFRTGRAMPVSANAFAITDASGKRTGFATITRDRRELQRIEIGMRALADAGRAMHESLELETTLQNIADAIVSGFASNCGIEVVDANGTFRTVTHGARDPAQIPFAAKASETRNAAMPPDHPIRRAIEHGESTLKILDTNFLKSTGLDAHIGPKPGMIDLSSVIYVPVRSPRDGRIYGSLSCGLSASDPRGLYSQDDIPFAEEIAIRAGLAFDNAQAYERTRRVAVEMQAASLPVRMPEQSALALHAEYRPAADEATIGGDWYDAFILPDGRIVMTIGDVVGHGLKAAIWMTKLRQALQAAALLDAHPRVMLGVADRAIAMLEGDVYATALVAIYDPMSGRLSMASAGHPAPLIVRADGSLEEVSCNGTMLGIPARSTFETRTVEIASGDLVVFYTDGLVEAGRDLRSGLDRLHEALGIESVRGAENPALAVYERVLGNAAVADDVAILTARVC
jgi:PAS domain S-box-containing protein